MKTCLGLACVMALSGCGGSDNTTGDGGNDATTTDGASNDGAVTDSGHDSGGGNDSGTADSGNDSGGGTLFPCGTATCDSATQYCNLQEFGPQPADGGFVGTATCIPYPTICGSAPSCACLPHILMCTCAENGPDITNKCGGV